MHSLAELIELLRKDAERVRGEHRRNARHYRGVVASRGSLVVEYHLAEARPHSPLLYEERHLGRMMR